MDVNIITDNEWNGKYAKVCGFVANKPEQFVFSLGDNLETGLRGNTGAGSFFKIQRKKLKPSRPDIENLSLDEQLTLVHNSDPGGFMVAYGDAIEIIRTFVDDIKRIEIPEIIAITGNREYDYQIVLDTIAKLKSIDTINYLDELKKISQITMLEFPLCKDIGGSAFLFLPYNPGITGQYISNLRDCYDALSELNKERLILLTHENPTAKNHGRQIPKMKKVIDDTISTLLKISQDVSVFCGHLDLSLPQIEYNSTKLIPLSSGELCRYDPITGDHTIITL